MNKNFRALLVVAAFLSLGLTGCLTHELRERIKSDSSYSEEVTSVMVSEDGKKLVFIGNGYHYVFDAPIELSLSLNSSFRKSLFAKFKNLRVDKRNNIKGNLTVILDESASQKNKDEAIAFGYANRSGRPDLELSLQGKRYKSGGVATDSVGYKLNYTYRVNVLEERSSLEKTALTAATPISVLADGVLVIGGVPLVILMGVTPH